MTDQKHPSCPDPWEKADDNDPLAHTTVTEVLQAFADPVRMEIVCKLNKLGEAGCRDLDLPVTKSTATHHFQILRNAGIIATRQVGTTRLSRLRKAEMERYFPALLTAILSARCKSCG